MTICWINRGCVNLVSGSYSGSYVSRLFAVVEQSVTASRNVDCVVPCKSVEVGRSTSSVMTLCWINRGCVNLVSAPYSGSCVSRYVAVVEHVTASRNVDCVVPCKSVEVADNGYGLGSRQSRADVSDGNESFAVSKPCGQWLWLGSGKSRAGERTRAKALSSPKPCGRADENEGFVGSKPCGRADESEGFVGSKAVQASGRERRLCRLKAVRASWRERRLSRVKAVRTSGRERRLCCVKAVRTNGQVKRPRLRWALS